MSSYAQENKSVFAELGGNGLFLSANYDSRFTKKENGFGFRVGIGMYPGSIVSTPFVNFPLGINHLAGNGPHYFESGLGVTIVPMANVFGYEVSGVLFVPSAGYRFARTGPGFQLRIFLSPWIGEGGVSFALGLSCGYKF